jgi:hypothetical protein
MSMTDEHKRKIGLGNLGKVRTPEVRDRIRKTLTGRSCPEHSLKLLGRHNTSEHNARISAFQRGRKTNFDAVAITDKRIKDELVELRKQGFVCVPVGGKIRPDIVGFKDGKVYAIEVEYKQQPNYSKYTDDARSYFDGVIWINKHKYAKPEIKHE